MQDEIKDEDVAVAVEGIPVEDVAVKEEPKKKLKYNVITVEKSTAPEGMTGDNWHRYVIGQGGSKIEGKKPGTLKEVTLHAKIAAEDLNSRVGGSGSTYVSRKRT